MEIPREDLERFMFFEQAREQAMADLKKNPRDAEVRRIFRYCCMSGLLVLQWLIPASKPSKRGWVQDMDEFSVVDADVKPCLS